MDKISIIMPVYNCSEYLNRCIESIVNQDYDNLEIIIINDGSTDDSVKICEHFRKKDSRIKIINQKNQGTAIAKNIGLSVASGQFIYFIDADDWLPSNRVFSVLYDILKRNDADISVGDLNTFNNKTNKYYIHFHDGKQMNFTPREWFKLQYEYSQKFSTPWGKLFKKSLFKNIRFPKRAIAEDDYTMWKLYLLASTISYVNKPLYVYRQNRSGSITNSVNLSQSFSLGPIEERIAMEHLIKYKDIADTIETNALKYRLNMHQYALQIADQSDYKHYMQINKILNKF